MTDTNVTELDRPYVRLVVNLAVDVADAFKALCKSRGITATEGVRRAIALWKLVEDANAKGETVQIVSADGKRVRELVLF